MFNIVDVIDVIDLIDLTPPMIDLINRYPDRDPVLVARTSSHGEYVGLGLNRGTKCTDATTCDSDSACPEGYRCYILTKDDIETTQDTSAAVYITENVPWWVPGCGMSETYVTSICMIHVGCGTRDVT